MFKTGSYMNLQGFACAASSYVALRSMMMLLGPLYAVLTNILLFLLIFLLKIPEQRNYKNNILN
jgi:hypothetical protein